MIIQVAETISCVWVTWSLEKQMNKALVFLLLPGVRGWFCLDARWPPSYSTTSPSPGDIRWKNVIGQQRQFSRAKMEGCASTCKENKAEFILYFPSIRNAQLLPRKQDCSYSKLCPNPSHGQGWPAAHSYTQSSALAWLRSFWQSRVSITSGWKWCSKLLKPFTLRLWKEGIFLALILQYYIILLSDLLTCIVIFLKDPYLLKPFNNLTWYICFLNSHNYFCILLSIVWYINL